MKTLNVFLTAILAIAAGVAIIIANQDITAKGVVVAAGIIFIIAGIVNGCVFNFERRAGTITAGISLLTNIGSVAAILLGICLLVFKATFITLVPYVFGVLVAFIAIYHCYILAVGARPATLPAWLYLVSIVLAAFAVYIFLQKTDNEMADHRIIFVSGIALAFFGIFGVIEGCMIPHYRKKALNPEKPEKIDKTETSEKSEPSEPSENTEPSEKSENSESPEKSETKYIKS